MPKFLNPYIEPMSDFHATPGRTNVHSHFFKLISEI